MNTVLGRPFIPSGQWPSWDTQQAGFRNHHVGIFPPKGHSDVR